MQTLFCCIAVIASAYVSAKPAQETPQQSLNQYVAFLNGSVDELTNRFQMIQHYQVDANQYRKKPDLRLKVPSSGPLQDYYYRKALAGDGLTQAEKQLLTASAEALWQLVNKIDQTGKALETYVRLTDYQPDKLIQSDALVGEMQTLFAQFGREKDAFFKQIERVYRRYQPYIPTNPYLFTEKEMEQVIRSQQRLLDSLPYYLNEDSRSNWPVDLVEKSMLADEKVLADFGTAKVKIGYPASDMVSRFRTAIQSLQAVKRRAIDNNTFAARQSASHGNDVYRSLLNYYNQDLLASHQAFVKYSHVGPPIAEPAEIQSGFCH